MGYKHLFAERDLALLYDWLRESGELYVDVDRPHCGALNNSVYFVENLPVLKEIVSGETFPEVCIYIFREKQYPIRGIVNDSLLATALDQIPDRHWFSILASGCGPLAPWNVIAYGDCHDELCEAFVRLAGKSVRIGQNPFDYADDREFFQKSDDVWVVRSFNNLEPRISKNRANYGPFENNPDLYRAYIDFW